MKALASILGFFILFTFAVNDSMAQKAIYTTGGGWSVGAGAGASYQRSDLPNSGGYGLDFVLGSQLFHKENAFLGLEWKFRFLAGQNRAYDHSINTDFTYSNIQYNFFTYDLELGLTLNWLRERTGIVLTGFAGAGVTFGRTFTDLYNGGTNLYDYGSIDPDRDRKMVYRDLVAVSDGDFETSLVKKAALLPTAGIFIGYQFTRSLTVGVEYKTNFYLKEENDLFSIDLDNRITPGSGMDRNNYVSLGLKWNFMSSSSGRGANMYSNSSATDYQGNSARRNRDAISGSLPHPSVNITEPSAPSYLTESQSQIVRATINNVDGPDNIRFSRNGFPLNTFTYNKNTKIFTANVRLREGENNFRIEAVNQASAAEDEVMITLEQPLSVVLPAPWVEFTSPSGSQHTSSGEKVDVTASVKNVTGKDDIQLLMNGIEVPFEYYAYSGLVRTSVYRSAEDIHLMIKASNESGSTRDQLIVHFSVLEEIADPVVRFINPPNPVVVTSNRFPLSAETQNVRGINDVALSVNGASIGNFSFSADGIVSVNLFLSEGDNTIDISAKNEAGQVSERTFITFHRAENVVHVYNNPGYNSPGYSNPGYSNPGYSNPGYTNPGYTNPGYSNPGYTNPVYVGTVNTAPVRTESGYTAPRNTEPRYTAPGSPTPGNTEPGNAVPGSGEETGAIRFNPGNSAWQFCMVTPSGTINRENLTNSNFSYSGTASSLYFMPIGGGGNAIVNGGPYTLKSGQYYLFTGFLNVSVGTRNPGSMGHWSVRIVADRAPVTGNGNNRPSSPCMQSNSKDVKDNSKPAKDNSKDVKDNSKPAKDNSKDVKDNSKPAKDNSKAGNENSGKVKENSSGNNGNRNSVSNGKGTGNGNNQTDNKSESRTRNSSDKSPNGRPRR